MSVNETLALRDALASERLGLDAVILNAMYPARFDADDVTALNAALRQAEDPLVRAALRAALSEHARAAAQGDQRARLAEGVGSLLIELPYLFAEEIGRDQLELLADALAAGLERRPEPTPRPTEDPVR